MPQNHRCVIFGAGGHARVIAALVEPDSDVVYVVPEPQSAGHIAEERFFAQVDAWRSSRVYLGIGDNTLREALWWRLQSVGIAPATIVSPRATVDRTATLAAGVMLSHGAVVCAHARLDENVVINTMASVDHDCIVGRGTHLATAAHLGGGVTLGARCFLSMGAIVTPGVTLGDDTVVMAGAVVVRDFAGGGVLGGSPARPIRRDQGRTDDEGKP